MFLVDDRESEPISDLESLIGYFRSAEKGRSEWLVGTEHEMIGVLSREPNLGAAVPYQGERGLGAILENLDAAGWTSIREGDAIIALTCTESQIAIEPGGQLEHAARPLADPTAVAPDLMRFLEQIADCTDQQGLAWLNTGFRPFGTLQDVPWMPKKRYEIMRDYLPTRGRLAHEMMKRTATVQVNLDYADETDAHRKVRAAMGIQPVLTAIFANSPIVDGAISGYQSYRARVWTEVDPDRCGLLDFVFEDGDFYRAYTEWALDVPMFFVHRNGYVPAAGTTFRQFWKEGFQGHKPTMADWGLHLSTLFPEVRMKKFLELRGCDAGSMEMTVALGVLAEAILYDYDALEATIALTAGMSFVDRQAFLDVVAKDGLRATAPGLGRSVADLARDLCDIASKAAARLSPQRDVMLTPIREVVDEGRSPADKMIALWNETRGEPAAVIAELAYDLRAGSLEL